jgi:rhodanese-related sulfurtransferase
MDRGDKLILVETLPAQAYQKAHLPGAVNLPPDQVREAAPRPLPDQGAEIVVYCPGPT